MATQSCAPAQGRSSRSEPSSMPHIGCTRRQREKNRGGAGGGLWGEPGRGVGGRKKKKKKTTSK